MFKSLYSITHTLNNCHLLISIQTVYISTVYYAWVTWVETNDMGCTPQNFINPDVFSSDIDECQPTSDCMHQCNNTDGSYECYCNEFFTVDPNDPKSCTRKFWSVKLIEIIV